MSIVDDFKSPIIKGNRGTLLCKSTSRHEACLDSRYMEHIAQGDLVALRAFEDDSVNTNLIDCGLISKAYSAINKGVVLEVRSAGCNVMCSTTVHHPVGFHFGSIQGSSKVIINLLNGGRRRYKYVCISCLAARIPLLLLFVCGLIPLLFWQSGFIWPFRLQ